MITAFANLLIVAIVLGLLLLGLVWVIENIFKVAIPMVVKQAVGLIALILVGLYVLHTFGVY